MTAPSAAGDASKGRNVAYKDKSKPGDVRSSNINAAKAVCDAIRTSLGPRGMDKMIQSANGEVTITNDGATILKQINVIHPAAKMLVELSRAQDVEAGDGTTTVVVIAGALLNAAEKLLSRGIHPTVISDNFQKAAVHAVNILNEISIPVVLKNRDQLLQSASTSLNSKVVSQQSSSLAPIAVDAVLKIVETGREQACNLSDIKVIKQLGGTTEDTELVDGWKRPRSRSSSSAFPPPKTDMDHNVIVSDYAQMDRVLKEERAYILNIVKQIKKAGCNVLLIQKSILRDAVSDLALHFLDKIKCMVVKDVEREDVEFVCKTLGCRPIASLDHFVPESLVNADLIEEVGFGGNRMVKITGVQNPGKTVTILVRGSNKLVLDEAERSLHDALCVIRCLVRKPHVIAGGGAPEIELAIKLAKLANTSEGVAQICLRAYAESLEIVPFTLAENAGLNPIQTVTELRSKHAKGESTAGINVRKGTISNILEEDVVQPLLVTVSAITLATETVRSILKIDDIVNTFT
ncbi:unnamed protein product [Brassicogethes aeneus]|uniref:T-complex protein 1 subunit delta n=1 Tax=Brassicogethes aeneus TaxID=1431903 RepID=A0A9P0BEM5_BRAAE|nr:unnamed protein product [Brassicogethes aeneus]